MRKAKSAMRFPSDSAVRKALYAQSEPGVAMEKELERMRLEVASLKAWKEHHQELVKNQTKKDTAIRDTGHEREILARLKSMETFIHDSHGTQSKQVAALSGVSSTAENMQTELLDRIQELIQITRKEKRYSFEVIRNDDGFIDHVEAQVIETH